MDWDVLSNGLVLLSCGYHILIASFYSPLSINQISANYPTAIVLQVPYNRDSFYYIVSKEMVHVKP